MIKLKRTSVHDSLNLKEDFKLVFNSFSKKNFYLRTQISAYTLLQGKVPVNPFMNFDYNLSSAVDKSLIRIANNTMIKKSDELWVFGEISDGVLVEIYLAKKNKKPVRFFIPNENIHDFKEIKMEDATLENVSPWVWEWVLSGKKLERWHPRLQFTKTYPLVYPAYSKQNFFWQAHISQFCIEKKRIPLNPFMLFRYFLGDIVPREHVYRANINIVVRLDELWAFGQVSDGVLAEIKIAHEQGKKVKYFKIISGNPVKFRQIPPRYVKFEENELEKHRSLL